MYNSASYNINGRFLFSLSLLHILSFLCIILLTLSSSLQNCVVGYSFSSNKRIRILFSLSFETTLRGCLLCAVYSAKVN